VFAEVIFTMKFVGAGMILPNVTRNSDEVEDIKLTFCGVGEIDSDSAEENTKLVGRESESFTEGFIT
jgi:hypothetical protein